MALALYSGIQPEFVERQTAAAAVTDHAPHPVAYCYCDWFSPMLNEKINFTGAYDIYYEDRNSYCSVLAFTQSHQKRTHHLKM